ncbi:MAG TPA: hypothetical protein PLN33_12330 [Hyphomonadaceae bacterium]|jgi:hypothetical protein|nr:hypothetical protein [Hyphomonadaceae bacterium]HPN05496.1 hypothetical protein [Hyphomonadaceae bacterium]
MGLFSFLTGGKKKEARSAAVKSAEAKFAPAAVAPPPSKPTIVETKAEAALAMAAAPIAPVVIATLGEVTATGVTQAKLRLKLAAALRARQHMAAYEAARGLADIQVKAGRPTVARVWLVQADKLKAQLAA